MIENPISSSTLSVQMCYENYLNNKYVVNRKYQRKLVWTLEEKQSFIDSLSNNYSVPLFLFAIKEEEGNIQYEIIDGMQRLNSVMAFIENEYPVKLKGVNGYFDLNTLSSTKSLLDQGILKQKTPVLDRQVCVNITNYQFPYTNINADTKSVEEIFRRINSFGKQLSKQEIRQAGAIGLFPDLVRIVSSSIRGDVSPSDSVTLNKMKGISLSNKKLDYGIIMENVYWVKQKIITVPNMRVSRDEELVAWILVYMILGKDSNPTAMELDRIYRRNISVKGVELADVVENKLALLQSATVKEWYLRVHSVIQSILDYAKDNFRSLVYQGDYSEGLVRTYQIIFLAIFELIIIDKMILSNTNLLVNALKQIAHNHLNGIGDKKWNARLRYNYIQSVKGIIGKCFKKSNASDVITENWTFELSNLLRMSRIEGSQYDFKMGLHDLYSGELNKDLPLKIVEILTAQANKGPQSKGYVFIGITERGESFEQYKRTYGNSNADKIEGTDFYVTGVQDEIKKYYSGSGDKLQNEFFTLINKAPVDKSVLQQIKQNFKMVKYGSVDVIVLELESSDKPITYNGKIHYREGNMTSVIEDPKSTIEYCKRIFKTTDLI